jgi:hypothetical protein
MPANFPTTPTINETYTYAGVTWSWTGNRWQVQSPSAIGGGSGAVYDVASTSTGYFDLPSGNTQQRPETPDTGMIRYNSTTGFAEVYTSVGWGSFGEQPPSIGSVTPATYNGEANTEFTIIGANFTSDATVKFVDNAGTEYIASTVIFVDSATLRARTPQDFTVAQEPLDVKVVQASGQVTRIDCIDCGGTPTWSTTSGTIATYVFPTDANYNVSVLAIDPDANATISYSLTSGSLPTGANLSLLFGNITGNIPNPGASSVTSNFDITATDNAGNQSTRSFNIIRQWADGSTSARAGSSASAIKLLTSTTTNGKYWVRINGVAREIYCNMADDGGGWMLYTSFSSINEFANSTNFPAIYGNGLTNTNITNFGYSTNYTSYHDGTTDNLGYTYSGSTYQGPYSFFYSASTNGTISMNSWNGPSSGITQMRVRYGGGASNYNPGGPGGLININNGAVTLAQNDSLSGAIAFGNFNTAGATPYFQAVEVGIMGLWWIMVR